MKTVKENKRTMVDIDFKDEKNVYNGEYFTNGYYLISNDYVCSKIKEKICFYIKDKKEYKDNIPNIPCILPKKIGEYEITTTPIVIKDEKNEVIYKRILKTNCTERKYIVADDEIFSKLQNILSFGGIQYTMHTTERWNGAIEFRTESNLIAMLMPVCYRQDDINTLINTLYN